MIDTKEYVALQQECERLRAENQRLNKSLARYRAQYGELPETDKGEEIGAQSVEEIKSGESRVIALSSDSAIVTNQSPSEEKIKLFRSLFRGREDIYAKRWSSEKSGKSGYQPVCLNEWNTWLCDKRKTRCSECKNRKFAPLDDGANICRGSLRKEQMSSAFIRLPRTNIVIFWRWTLMAAVGKTTSLPCAQYAENMKSLSSSSVPVPGLVVTSGFSLRRKFAQSLHGNSGRYF